MRFTLTGRGVVIDAGSTLFCGAGEKGCMTNPRDSMMVPVNAD
ncbi:MAG: hypothetical protein AB7S61_01705 [Methanoregulaceae archaeon]